MWEKSKYQTFSIAFSSLLCEPFDYFFMSQMNTVKCSKRGNGIFVGFKILYVVENIQNGGIIFLAKLSYMPNKKNFWVHILLMP